jgi:hypothetical protein
MLVLFDQSTPVPIRPFLREHKVETTWQRGWGKLKNGDLLKAAEEAGFEVLVTPDKNIRYQQNLKELQNCDRRRGKSAVAGAASPCGSNRGGCKRGRAWHLLRG